MSSERTVRRQIIIELILVVQDIERRQTFNQSNRSRERRVRVRVQDITSTINLIS